MCLKLVKYLLPFILSSFLCLNVHAQVFNRGLSGNSTVQLLLRVDQDVIQEHPDLVIILVGTNDLLNSRKMMSLQDYALNLKALLENLKGTGSKVLLLSPPPVDSAYLFTRHDKSLYLMSPNQLLDSASQIMCKIAYENDALFLDLYGAFCRLGVPRHNEDLFIRNQNNSGVDDGVHPTTLGYHFIAESIFQFLEATNLLQPGMKVVCFGDSITYGVGAKGGGTVEGWNYPSFLSRMIMGDLEFAK